MIDRNHLAEISKLDRIIIQHPDFERAFIGIQECVLKSSYYREPIGCILSADGGMGKTTVCKAIMSTMPGSIEKTEGFEVTTIPAFYAEIPSPATVKSVAASMLTQLNDPNPLIGNASQLTVRLCRLLRRCGTKLVFLDELHNLLDVTKSRTRINNNVCNWIKSIVNSTSVSICLVGLPGFAPILSTDSQLSRRFPMHYKLGRLTLGSQYSMGTLSPFLQAITNHAKDILGFDSAPDFRDYHSTCQVYAGTSGNPSFIVSLVKESALQALSKGSNNLRIEDFSSAWQTGITAKASMTNKNPFDMSPGTLSSYLGSA